MSVKISSLPPATIANDADVIPLVQGGTTKKAAVSLVRPAFGSTSNTVCAGDDPRLSDPRNPKGPASGDLTNEYPGPALTTTGVVALTYGGAAQVGQFTVDAKGRITSAASVAITPAAIGALSLASLGANVSTFLATPSSANLAAALTDETGSGAAVFATSPTIGNPTINGYVEGNTNLGTVGASATLSIASSTVLTATLTDGTQTTFTMPAAAAGKAFTLYLKQPAVGAIGSAVFTGVKWQNGGAPIITQLNGKLDILPFVSDGVNWYGSFAQNFAY